VFFFFDVAKYFLQEILLDKITINNKTFFKIFNMTLLIHVLGNRDKLSFYGIFVCEKIFFKAMMYFYLIKKKIKNSDCKMSDFFSFFIFFNFFFT